MDEKELENISEVELQQLQMVAKFCLGIKQICEKFALDYIAELQKLTTAMFNTTIEISKEETNELC